MSIKQILHCDNLTGATNSTYLDYYTGTSLTDKDRALVINSATFYLYEFNAASSAAESSPNIIATADNVGRWILINQYALISGLAITAGKTITVTQDTSLDEAVAMSSKAPKASPVFTGNSTDTASASTTFTSNDVNVSAALLATAFSATKVTVIVTPDSVILNPYFFEVYVCADSAGTLTIRKVLKDGLDAGGTTGITIGNVDTIGFTISAGALKINADNLGYTNRDIRAFSRFFKPA